MTAAEQTPAELESEPGPEEGLRQRPGTDDSVEFDRYYFDTPDGRQHLDFDGRIWAIEAVGLKKVAQMSHLEVLGGVQVADAEALRALFWMIRKHRLGEVGLKLEQVNFDATTVTQYPIDGAGYRVMRPPADPPDPVQVQAAAAVLMDALPGLDEEPAMLAASFAVAALPKPEPDPEAGAAAEAAPTTGTPPAPDEQPRTAPTDAGDSSATT